MFLSISKRRLVLSGLAIATVTSGVMYPSIRDHCGPMKHIESQCLLCGRDRVQHWTLGTKTLDRITENALSNWVDTFLSRDHDHIWNGVTSIFRTRWFGGTPIGCGGYSALGNIYYRRDKLGEKEAIRLAEDWQQIVREFEKDRRNHRLLDDFERQFIAKHY